MARASRRASTASAGGWNARAAGCISSDGSRRAWSPGRLAAPRGRQILTPRVAALLAASEAADRLAVEIRRPLARGDVVLADRYAWTAVAREVARGLEPEWVAALYRFMPRPDLVIFHRQEPAAALARALATRPTPVGAEAIAAAYATFLDRLLAAYERLLAEPAAGPWPVPSLIARPARRTGRPGRCHPRAGPAAARWRPRARGRRRERGDREPPRRRRRRACRALVPGHTASRVSCSCSRASIGPGGRPTCAGSRSTCATWAGA